MNAITLLKEDHKKVRGLLEELESTTSRGLDIRLASPDGQIIAIIAGRTDPEDSHTGVPRFVDDPAIAAAICAALAA